MNNIDITTLDNREKEAIVCLFFAQLDSEDSRYKGRVHPILKDIASKSGRKYSTLKNDLQRYDTLFENGRLGWHKESIEKKSPYLFRIYKKYKDLSVDELEVMSNEIISEAQIGGQRYYTIRTRDPRAVSEILNRSAGIELDGLNNFVDELEKGTMIFVVLGGDNPSWETGLVGIGVVSEPPYDRGYDRRNYKIKIDMQLLLYTPIKREELVEYRDTYDIIFIGPMTKWEPNQAIQQVPESKAISLMRAMLEIEYDIIEDLTRLVDIETLSRIKGPITKLVPLKYEYGESDECAFKQYFEEEIDESIDSNYDLSKEELDNDEIDFDFAEEYTKEDFLKDAFMEETDYDTLCNLLEEKKNVILQGPPGVGKTFIAKRLAYSILGRKYEKFTKTVQFHQSYSYEDFVVGYRPTEDGFELKEGPFFNFCQKAANDSRKHFFIIDEINRGNLSRIFGELLMLIEADKRGERVTLLYDNIEFSVPDNLYVIGMMNTADRSLALIDYALRRRFSFFEMSPAFENASFVEKISDSADSHLNDVINVIKDLNEEIKEDESTGKGFRIGHSYFCYDTPIDDDILNRIVEFEIIPLIDEYWFDEPAKVDEWSNKLREAIKK